MNAMIYLAAWLTEQRLFKSVVFALILLSAAITGIETYQRLSEIWHPQLILMDRVIVSGFTVEILLKILARGKKPLSFFRDPWNVFDFIIVAICLFPAGDTHYVAVFRVFRVLRVLRMITFFPKLRLLIDALLKSIPSMGYVVMLLFLLFYVYSIIGVFAFRTSDPAHFGNLHQAAMTLFKVLTLEGWVEIMEAQMPGGIAPLDEQIFSAGPFLFFASFILIGAMIVMNLFIGVIMNSMQESQEEMIKEIRDAGLKDGNAERMIGRLLERLDELKIDLNQLRSEIQGDYTRSAGKQTTHK